MTALLQQTLKKFMSLPPEQQDDVARYLDEHRDTFLKQVAKEKRISNGIYTVDDFNEETKKAIKNTAEGKNLTECKDVDDLFEKLGTEC